jgi:ADP-heptose:LPS heptosyltransferase
VLRTTPFLHAVRRAYPQAHITYAIGSYAAASLTNNPHIDTTIDMGLLGTPWRYDAQAYLGFARRLRLANFNVAFVLDRSPLMAMLPYIARIPYRIGLHNRGRGFTHTTRVPTSDNEHEVDAYLGVAEAVGVSTTDVSCHFHPTPKDIAAADRLCQEFGIATDQRLVIVAPGGGVNPATVDVSKRWPAENFARVADALGKRYNSAIAVVGLPSDATSIAAVRAHMTRPAIDLAGQTNFGQLGALIARSTLFIGNDSTSAQLAACVGTPSVTVFTTTEPWLYGPYGPEARWVHRGGPTTGLLGIPDTEEVERAAVAAFQLHHKASAHDPDVESRLRVERDPTL